MDKNEDNQSRLVVNQKTEQVSDAQTYLDSLDADKLRKRLSKERYTYQNHYLWDYCKIGPDGKVIEWTKRFCGVKMQDEGGINFRLSFFRYCILTIFLILFPSPSPPPLSPSWQARTGRASRTALRRFAAVSLDTVRAINFLTPFRRLRERNLLRDLKNRHWSWFYLLQR